MLEKRRDGSRWKTGDASGNQASQRSLNNTEKEMAVSAGNTKHSMQPIAPVISYALSINFGEQGQVAIDSQEAVACR